MKKKLFSLGMATAIAITSAASVSAVNLPIRQSNDLDALDVLVSAAICMNTTTDNLWPNQTKIDDIVPLYSPSGDKVAWYLELTTGEYAVVHNDKGNPAVIEFGEGGNMYIDELLYNNSNSKIVYNSPWDIYMIGSNMSSDFVNTQRSNDIYDYYPNLKNDNFQLSSKIEMAKREIIENNPEYAISPYDVSYDFIDKEDLPAGVCHSSTLPTSGIKWAVMEDYEDIAHDHCAATSATNVIVYFDHIGYDILENNNIDDTFETLHASVGNGPVFDFTGDLVDYCSNHGYTLGYNNYLRYSEIQDAISNDHICALLIDATILAMHWVLCIGWREYEPQYGGDLYFQIITNWKDNLNKYYMSSIDSYYLDGMEYWIE